MSFFILREKEREREREQAQVGEGQRERESPEQTPYYQHRAQRGADLTKGEITT